MIFLQKFHGMAEAYSLGTYDPLNRCASTLAASTGPGVLLRINYQTGLVGSIVVEGAPAG
jgi:hypothetical protein